MAGYGYISWAQLEAALLQRLQDTAGVFTTTAECSVYLQEALRVLNAQTAWQPTDYLFDFNPGDTWKSLNVSGSPRERTITDGQVVTQMEYMLLEPPTGLTYTGTNQFNSVNLDNALQFRRDELLQMTGANTINQIANSPVNTVRTILTDSTLDIRRVRWIPNAIFSTENPYALGRSDITAKDAYLYSQDVGNPDSWMVTANSPLSFDVAPAPAFPGQWDMLLLYAQNALTPPTPTVLGLPDDWCWVAMYGALADALGNAPESRDDLRAKYCRMRHERGMKAMMELPWLLSAEVSNYSVDTPSYKTMDAYAQNWENTWPADDPQIVVGGMDFIALAPFNPIGGSVISSVLTVVGNAPVDQGQAVQLSRDGVDAVLAYAQHLASFKHGGTTFMDTLPLYKQFEDYCASENRRYAALGIFRPDMLQEGNRADELDKRFEKPVAEEKALAIKGAE